MVFAVSGTSRLGNAWPCCSGGMAASSALPLAQQYSGNDSPTALMARRRRGGTTWSMKLRPVPVENRQVHRLVQLARQLRQERVHVRHDAEAHRAGHARDLGAQPVRTAGPARGHQTFVVQGVEDPAHRRARHSQPLTDLGLADPTRVRLQQPQDLGRASDDLDAATGVLYFGVDAHR